MFEPPSFTIGIRREMTIEKKGILLFPKVCLKGNPKIKKEQEPFVESRNATSCHII